MAEGDGRRAGRRWRSSADRRRCFEVNGDCGHALDQDARQRERPGVRPAPQAVVRASSTSDEIVRLQPGRGRGARAQDAAARRTGRTRCRATCATTRSAARSSSALFTGSPEGEEGGLGVELLPRAGGIIAVDPDTKHLRWVVSGLTVPTDLEIAPDGTMYVLEFCDAFLDPVGRPTRTLVQAAEPRRLQALLGPAAADRSAAAGGQPARRGAGYAHQPRALGVDALRRRGHGHARPPHPGTARRHAPRRASSSASRCPREGGPGDAPSPNP